MVRSVGAVALCFTGGVDAPWTALADALLRREVMRCRRERGPVADPLAGLKIDEDDVDRLLDGPGDPNRGERKEQSGLDKDVDRAGEALAATLRQPGQFAELCANAALDFGPAAVLSVLAAVELDPRRQRIVAYIQDDVTKPRPTIALLRDLFGEAGALAVSPASRLRHAGLVEVDESGAWGSAPVSVAPQVLWVLTGERGLDPELPPAAWTIPGGDGAGERLVLVSGADRTRRLQAAVEAAGAPAFLVTPVPESPKEWSAVVRTATLAGLGVILEVGPSLAPDARRRIEEADHLAWALSSVAELPLEDLPRRPWVERRAVEPEITDDEWHGALGEQLRAGHRLSAEQLRLVAGASAGLGGDIDAAIRRLASGHLDQHARRIRPRKKWDDLVLSADKLAQLREMVNRYRHRDKVHGDWGFPVFPSAGLVAMFSGPSGTGKTLAAEIVAGELGLDLYKLDLSAVVSKYIGETEQNLERVFNAASAGNLVLFFDEADSLFGKRSEVTDARDRYANIEVSYLLQRLESYDGLVVMATNFQKNIDEAFLRRIHVGIEFAVPEEPERLRIWQQAFPPDAPLADLDWDFLARQFKLAGGAIKNAALHAAFLAAEADTQITMEAIMFGLKREFQKLGRLRTAADFGHYAELVNS
jgi:AAA+ superfamily predicted ATPase